MRRRKKSKIKRFFLTLILLAIIAYIFLHIISWKPLRFRISFENLNSSRLIKNEITPIPTDTLQTNNPLGKVVVKTLEGTHGTYGIVIKNLKSGESYSYNSNIVFESASLYKLWVMATAYSQIQQKKLSETEILSNNVVTLNKEMGINADSALLDSGTITMNVSDVLLQMITISNNYDAQLMTDRIGLANISQFLSKNKFNSSRIGKNGNLPTTTASDIAEFYSKLYKGNLANKTYTQEMIGMLEQQQLNEKIPEYLPQSTVIAHKTGELNDYSHDAGIVYISNGPYIIVVLSKTDDPSEADERIANISQSVYNYFQTGN